MFNKNAYSIDTIIGAGTSLSGDIKVSGAVKIDGSLEGGIIRAQCVIVGTEGVIKGDIYATDIRVGGQIYGNVYNNNFIEISKNAKFYGNIETNQIEILQGGKFEGKCKNRMSHANRQIEVLQTA